MPRVAALKRAGAVVVVVVGLWATVAGESVILDRPVADPDAIVSLASHEWERLPVTAELAKRFPRAVVLLTLPTEVNVHRCHDCFHRVERLAMLGVAPERIRIVRLTSEGTHGEAAAVRDFARRTPMHRLVIVTSVYHTRRALATFATTFAGTDVTLGIQPAWPTPLAHPRLWWLYPYDRWYVTYEWAGSIYYALHYGVDVIRVG